MLNVINGSKRLDIIYKSYKLMWEEMVSIEEEIGKIESLFKGEKRKMVEKLRMRLSEAVLISMIDEGLNCKTLSEKEKLRMIVLAMGFMRSEQIDIEEGFSKLECRVNNHRKEKIKEVRERMRKMITALSVL